MHSPGGNPAALYLRTTFDDRRGDSTAILRCPPQRPVMETAGKAKTSAGGSAGSAGTYLAGLSMIVASYFGFAESALLLPAINPAATPLWPPTGLALALVLLGGYRVWPAILLGPVSPYLMGGRSPFECGSVGIGTLLAAFTGTWLII